MDAPKNVSELRSFLGMVNQMGRFIPNLAEKDKVLRDLLSKKNHWSWGTEQQAVFNRLKKKLSSTPVLALYNPNSALKISADASSFGLGQSCCRRGTPCGHLLHMHPGQCHQLSSAMLK